MRRHIPGRGSLGLVVVLALLAAWPCIATAQDISISLGEDTTGLSARVVQLLLLITVLSLAPGLAIMITCFPFIVTVLSILRQAIGLQQSPPNMLIVSLALFLTYFVMAPVFEEAWRAGIEPLIAGTQEVEAALAAALAPFRVFMAEPGRRRDLQASRICAAHLSIQAPMRIYRS